VDPRNPDVGFWYKAAQVARRQQNAEYCASGRIKGISPLELRAIQEQRKLGFWQQPRPLRVTIVTLCLAAITQGWLQTGLVSNDTLFRCKDDESDRRQNGGNLTWGKAFGLTDKEGTPTESPEIWIFAAINAALYFSASIAGCWLSDPLQSLILGRRGAIFFSACLCLAGAVGCAFSNSWQQLLGCRIVLGAAMGAKASVTPIYGAEVSPTHLR